MDRPSAGGEAGEDGTSTSGKASDIWPQSTELKASTLMQRELKKEGKRRAVRTKQQTNGARGRQAVVRRERGPSPSDGNKGEQGINHDSER